MLTTLLIKLDTTGVHENIGFKIGRKHYTKT